MNQTRKNVRSTKSKQPFEQANAASLRGKKVQDLYVNVYDVRETIFSVQTGQFPTRSMRGNKYVMVLVEIDSNAILLEPLKSRQDSELIRAYDSLITRLRRAGINPRKHVLDNEISENMKNHIHDHYKFQLELVPPSCHRRNAPPKLPFKISRHIFSVSLLVQRIFFLQVYGTASYYKLKSLSIYYDNQMQPPLFPHTLICVVHSTTTKCLWHQWGAKL